MLFLFGLIDKANDVFAGDKGLEKLAVHLCLKSLGSQLLVHRVLIKDNLAELLNFFVRCLLEVFQDLAIVCTQVLDHVVFLDAIDVGGLGQDFSGHHV
jgi:hypothetical protein